jgi:hypothetical protein
MRFRSILAPRPRNAARHHEGATSKRRRRPRPGWGPWPFSSRKGAPGMREGRKAHRKPTRSQRPSISLACDRASSRPRKARGVPGFASANPARGSMGPGSATPVRQPGGCCVAPRGDIHAPEALLLRSLPQPMGAGSSRPLSPARRVFMPHEGSVPRLQGRKTLASLLGQRPRERPPRDGKPTANDGATARRKRAWRTETAE